MRKGERLEGSFCCKVGGSKAKVDITDNSQDREIKELDMKISYEIKGKINDKDMEVEDVDMSEKNTQRKGIQMYKLVY